MNSQKESNNFSIIDHLISFIFLSASERERERKIEREISDFSLQTFSILNFFFFVRILDVSIFSHYAS